MEWERKKETRLAQNKVQRRSFIKKPVVLLVRQKAN